MPIQTYKLLDIFRMLLFIHSMQYYVIIMLVIFTVTKIKQEKTNQDKTKIGPFFDFLLHFSTFLLEILNKVLQLSCEAMLKISSRNIEK